LANNGKATRGISLIQRIFYFPYVQYELKRAKPDLIHAHFSIIGWEYQKLANALKLPLIISFYGFDYENLPHTQPIWKTRYLTLFKQATAFICEGHFGAQVLHQMGCPKEKIHIVKLGVDIKAIPFFLRSKTNNELKLLQIATFKEKKGHIYTVQAFAKALKVCPNMTLTLVGKDNGTGIKEQIMQVIEQHQIHHKVTLLDGIDFDHLHEFMRDFHVFIHPSCYSKQKDCEGGAPVVLLDAQATGMPVISTTHCDIPDEVNDGETGYLVPEKNVDALCDTIIKFYEMDTQTYRRFSENAREHVSNNYDAKKNSERLKAIYELILKQ